MASPDPSPRPPGNPNWSKGMIEKAIVHSGIILLKYWLEVNPQEQSRRLNSCFEAGRKAWKLSPMDLKSYGR